MSHRIKKQWWLFRIKYDGTKVIFLTHYKFYTAKDALNEYQKTYLEMMKALLPIQRPDGFWNASLHDPDNFGGKETTGTALFVYGLAWGVNKGLLSKKKYTLAIAKGWNALATEAVHPDGYLGYVQGTGKQPSEGQPVAYDSKPDFEDYGLGCFLLAGSEVVKLCK